MAFDGMFPRGARWGRMPENSLGGWRLESSRHNSCKTPPAPNNLCVIAEDERFYTLEQKPVLVLGQLDQHQYPDGCACVEAPGTKPEVEVSPSKVS